MLSERNNPMARLEFIGDLAGSTPVYPRECSCAFTGHRVIPRADYERIKSNTVAAVRALLARGFYHFLVGGALGFDTLAARIILMLRESHPEIRLTVAVPCEGQSDGWQEADRVRYEKIIEHADRALLLSRGYSRSAMLKRNRYMIDNSAACIAYLTKNRGGSAYTVNYASERGLEIINTENISAL